jgi:hypothetical protein
MRKHHQNQILELLGTLREAHAEIRRRVSRGDIAVAADLSAECQNGALQLGNFIERLAGAGTKTVLRLEEYRALLCRASEAFGAEKVDDGANPNHVKRLQKQLTVIENSVKSEFAPDRIEVAFVPYKAAMWDALESVWLAARGDPACDAYVIPAPYYDRLPDGRFGKMHYEGNLYPGCVPVTDWQNYDFAERRPDMIFTHNPYDDGNLVTCIHPDFYCKRLKEFTDLLVYIPYFVTADDVREQFCVCAGTIYADRAIMQSEKVRRTYIRVFREFEKKNNCKNRFGRPENKFPALGSPKFDRIINAKREDCQMPEAWRRLIEKPGGALKKVILYNTTVGALLEGNERVLRKLRYVFGLFRGFDDVVLLWRPHPLNLTTYEAMRSALLKEYVEIALWYKKEGFGICDDGADTNPAILLSDAYYGDWSSLVSQYHCTGKPIMIQSIDVLEEEVQGVQPEESADANPHVPPYAHILDRTGVACETSLDCYLYESPQLGPRDLAEAVLRGGYGPAMREKQLELRGLFAENADGGTGRAIFSECKRAVIGR